MNEKEILTLLWEAHRETPFATFSLQRKLDLRHDDLAAVLNLLNDMADSGETQNGYRIKRVADTVFKMTQAQAASTPYRPVERRLNDNPPLKGLPLIGRNEAVLGYLRAIPQRGYPDR